MCLWKLWIQPAKLAHWEKGDVTNPRGVSPRQGWPGNQWCCSDTGTHHFSWKHHSHTFWSVKCSWVFTWHEFFGNSRLVLCCSALPEVDKTKPPFWCIGLREGVSWTAESLWELPKSINPHSPDLQKRYQCQSRPGGTKQNPEKTFLCKDPSLQDTQGLSWSSVLNLEKIQSFGVIS